MAELKTKPTKRSVTSFLDGITDERRREDASTILALMQRITREEPRMWGASIVGFGTYQYRNSSGREGEWFITGFSPRKASLTLYIMPGFQRYAELMARLGKHKTGVSCLYINRLGDIHMPTLTTLIRESVRHMKTLHP